MQEINNRVVQVVDRNDKGNLVKRKWCNLQVLGLVETWVYWGSTGIMLSE